MSLMCLEAIKFLKEGTRNGSIIEKHIIPNYSDILFTPHQMCSALKKSTKSGKFINVNFSPAINRPLWIVAFWFCRCQRGCIFLEFRTFN